MLKSTKLKKTDDLEQNSVDLDQSILLSSKKKLLRKKLKLKQEHEHFNTNFMLLIVCFLFLIAEFPHSILIFFSIFSPNFYNFVYKPLGDLMDILVLINNSINFLLYCSMSKAFRLSVSSYFTSQPQT